MSKLAQSYSFNPDESLGICADANLSFIVISDSAFRTHVLSTQAELLYTIKDDKNRNCCALTISDITGTEGQQVVLGYNNGEIVALPIETGYALPHSKYFSKRRV